MSWIDRVVIIHKSHHFIALEFLHYLFIVIISPIFTHSSTHYLVFVSIELLLLFVFA